MFWGVRRVATLCDSKVDHLHASVTVDQYVAWLDVSVNDPGDVSVSNGTSRIPA
jgi:hypothetical protein